MTANSTRPQRPQRPPQRIAYILKRFPRLSETFILDEMLGLERSGIDLVVVAFGNPSESIINSDVKMLKAPVIYVGGSKSNFGDKLGVFFGDLLNHLLLLGRNPTQYMGNFSQFWHTSSKLAYLKNVNYGVRIARDLRDRHVVHVHAAFLHSPASAGIVAAKIIDTSFSCAGHAKDIYTTTGESLAFKIRNSDFVLTCSLMAKNEIMRRVLDRSDLTHNHIDKVILSHHGVDVERFSPAVTLKAHAPTHPQLTLLAVGRLVDKKGFNHLITAFAKVRANSPNALLKIVGDGPNKSQLELLAIELNVDSSIHFLGAMTRDQVLDELHGADVFVHPSVVLPNGDQDGIPNVVLEAMATGLCVIGSDIQGICEVIQNEITGLIVRSGDDEELASAMVICLENDDLRLRLGANARDLVSSNFSKKSGVDNVSKLMMPYVSTHAERSFNSVGPETVGF